MKEASTGQLYLSFQAGRVFIEKRESTVILSVYSTWNGALSNLKGKLIFSIKKRPAIYWVIPNFGIRNVTYAPLRDNIKNLVKVIANLKFQKDKHKLTEITNAFVSLSLKISIDTVNKISIKSAYTRQSKGFA